MWDRKELKEKAKTAFKANYWKTVIVSVIFLIIGGGATLFTTYNYGGDATSSEELTAQINAMSQNEIIAVILAVLGALAVASTIVFIIKIFLLNPLMVGCQKFFRENAESPADLDKLTRGFKPKYGNVVLTILLQDIFLLLWSLLFVIPGIVKAYSYRMVPFIIADNPEMSAVDVITKSRDIMRGHKWNTFVLDLSFLGWLILSGCTAGILGIFYVNPYMFETDAELYLALKDN